MSTAPRFGVAEQVDVHHPWPGLLAFTEADRDFFFGRSLEVDELFALCMHHRVTLLFGMSGRGKTSLLRAGLFPRLRERDFLPVRVRLDFEASAADPETQVLATLAQECQRLGVEAPPPAPGATVWEYLHAKQVEFWSARNRLLAPILIFDQFEEIFTRPRDLAGGRALREDVVRIIGDLAEGRVPIATKKALDRDPQGAEQFDFTNHRYRVLITLREDYLADLEELTAEMPSLRASRMRLTHMKGTTAVEAVLAAGAPAGLVAPAVATSIVRFVGHSAVARVDEEQALEDLPIEPALLSVVCEQLNRRRLAQGDAQISQHVLSSESESIIKNFYDRAFEGIEPRVREWVEDELLTGSGYRDQSALDDALRLGMTADGFRALVDRRILHSEQRDGVIWLELTHDLLTKPALQSRARRRERIEAETAAARKATLDRELMQMRKRASIYGVLLVAAAVALVFALTSAESARRSRDQAQRERENAQRANHGLNVANQMAEGSLQVALSTTRDLGGGVLDAILADLRVPGATIVDIVNRADASYQKLATEPVGQLQHAQFLAAAAEVYYEIGLIDQATKASASAIAIVSGLEKGGVVSDSHELVRARASYVRGMSETMWGRMSQAQTALEEAARRGFAVQAPSFGLLPATIFVQSSLQLAELDLLRNNEDAATARYHELRRYLAATSAGQANSGATQRRIWQARVLRGLARSERRIADRLRFATQANAIIEPLASADPSNLRMKALAAEIARSRGVNAYDLEQDELANQELLRSRRLTEDLIEHDPANRHWHLSRLRSLRALLDLYSRRKAWDLALQTSQQLTKETDRLAGDAAWWLNWKYMVGIAAFLEGDLQYNKLFDASRGTRALLLADLKGSTAFARAARHFQEGARRAPEYLDIPRAEALAVHRQGLVASQLADHTAALSSSRKALSRLQSLGPVARRSDGLLDVRAFFEASIAAALDELKNPKEALARYERAIGICTRLARRNPTAELHRRIGFMQQSAADASRTLKQLPDALARYEAATRAIDQALSMRPQDVALLREKSLIAGRISDVHYDAGDYAKSLDWLERATAPLWRALEIDQTLPILASDLGIYASRRQRLDTAILGAAKAKDGKISAADLKTYRARLEKIRLGDPRDRLLDRVDLGVLVSEPLINGDWQVLQGQELTRERELLAATDPRFVASKISGARSLLLPFYDNVSLREAELVQPVGQPVGILVYLRHPKGVVMLDGTSTPIHAFNRTTVPILDTREKASAYLRFYASAVQGEQGVFRLVDHASDLVWRTSATQADRQDAPGTMQRLVMEQLADGAWQAVAMVLYADTISRVSFRVYRGGDVQMGRDVLIRSRLEILSTAFRNGVRIADVAERRTLEDALKKNADDLVSAEKLPQIYTEVKRWTDGVEAQRGFIALLRKRNTDETRRRLPGAYLRLSWYQLIAHDYAGALESTEEGKKIAPDSMDLETNRAHALLMMGQTDEAIAVYTKYRGQAMPGSKRTWDSVILQDFIDLQKEGVGIAEFPPIRRILSTPLPK